MNQAKRAERAKRKAKENRLLRAALKRPPYNLHPYWARDEKLFF